MCLILRGGFTWLGIFAVLAFGIGCGSAERQFSPGEMASSTSVTGAAAGDAAPSERERQGSQGAGPEEHQQGDERDFAGAPPLDAGTCEAFDCGDVHALDAGHIEASTLEAVHDEAGSDAREASAGFMEGGAESDGAADGGTHETTAWRWESSLGLELEVPASWALNDYGCGQSDAPTLVRQQGYVLFCAVDEPATKQVIEISSAEPDAKPPAGLTAQAVRIGSDEAQRAEGLNADGRWYGWLHIPARSAIISLRVLDRQIGARVLDSVRVVEVDHHGCTTMRRQTPAPAADSRFVPEDASRISVCYFGRESVLQASTRLGEPEVTRLVELMNEASPGMNPDQPRDACSRSDYPPLNDAILIVESDDDRAVLSMSFSGCTGRGLSDGRTSAHVSQDLVLGLVANPLRIGVIFYGTLTP